MVVNKMQEVMDKKGITVEKMAKDLNMNPINIENLVTGKTPLHMVHVGTIDRVVKYLGGDFAELFEIK